MGFPLYNILQMTKFRNGGKKSGCQGLRMEVMAIKRASGDGTVLYLDQGGDYMNLHR